MRSVQDALDELTGPRYAKEYYRSKHLPSIRNREEALEELRILQHDYVITKPNYLDTSPLSREDNWNWKKERGLPLFSWVLVVFLVPVILLYVFRGKICWKLLRVPLYSNEGTLFWRWLYGKKGKVLDTILWLVLAPLLLILVRVLVFIFTHLFFSRGLWVFPNLLLDDDFLTIFSPVFEWDSNSKDSLGLRWRQFRNRMRAELGLEVKHRKNRKRKISPRAIRKATMYGKKN